MTLTGVIIILFAMASDCFVTAWHSGALHQKLGERLTYKLPFFFSAGRSIVLATGMLAGLSLTSFVGELSYVSGVSLLAVIGLKIFIESIKFVPEDKVILIDNNKTLTILTLAGSINTFFAGFGFGLIGTVFLTPVIVTFIITFVFSFAGMLFGKKKGLKPEIRLIFLFAGVLIFTLSIRLLILNFI